MARVRIERMSGLERRKQLSLAVRDVERTLGRLVRHPNWEQAVSVAGLDRGDTIDAHVRSVGASTP